MPETQGIRHMPQTPYDVCPARTVERSNQSAAELFIQSHFLQDRGRDFFDRLRRAG